MDKKKLMVQLGSSFGHKMAVLQKIESIQEQQKLKEKSLQA